MSIALPIVSLSPAFTAGLVLSLSLIMAIGPQNAHVLRMGLQRQHVWLTIAICVATDVALIALGVLGLAQLGGLSDKLQGALIGGGVLFLAVYGWQAFLRFRHPRAGGLTASGAPQALTRDGGGFRLARLEFGRHHATAHQLLGSGQLAGGLHHAVGGIALAVAAFVRK